MAGAQQGQVSSAVLTSALMPATVTLLVVVLYTLFQDMRPSSPIEDERLG